METCSPASQGGPSRGTGNLKADSKSSGNQAWAQTWITESCISTSLVCLLSLEGSMYAKGTGMGRWATVTTASSSVSEVDVVQMLQPSVVDMRPASFKGHVAIWGQKQDLVLILGVCVLSHRKSPIFPMNVGQGLMCLAPLMC
jgi:hypothetical protein